MHDSTCIRATFSKFRADFLNSLKAYANALQKLAVHGALIQADAHDYKTCHAFSTLVQQMAVKSECVYWDPSCVILESLLSHHITSTYASAALKMTHFWLSTIYPNPSFYTKRCVQPKWIFYVWLHAFRLSHLAFFFWNLGFPSRVTQLCGIVKEGWGLCTFILERIKMPVCNSANPHLPKCRIYVLPGLDWPYKGKTFVCTICSTQNNNAVFLPDCQIFWTLFYIILTIWKSCDNMFITFDFLYFRIFVESLTEKTKKTKGFLLKIIATFLCIWTIVLAQKPV